MTTFNCTLVSGKIHLVQDSGGASFTGNAKVEIYDFLLATSIVSIIAVTSGVSTSDYAFATSLNPRPNKSYYVRALDSATFNVSNKVHTTLTLTKLGTNSYTGAVYVAPFTWLSHVTAPATAPSGSTVVSTVHIAEGARTFAIEIDDANSSNVLYTGNVTTNSSGIGTVSYAVSGALGDTISPFVFQPDTSDIGQASNDIVIGELTMAAPTEPVVTPPSAPTAPTKPYRFTQVFRGLNNHKKTIVALGTSANNAFAFLTAEAKIRGGTNITALTETIRFDHTAAPALGGSGATVDAVLDLYRVADNSSRQLTIPDMLASYLITGTKFVDSTNTDIVAVGTAFEDEYGNTGYVVQVSSHSLN